jgi:hypothetical protein
MNTSYLGYEQLGYGPNFEIALNMPFEQLRFYCVSNELFRSICSDQEFWLQRLQREYSVLIQYKPIDQTYAQYYNDLKIGNVKFVPVVYIDRTIGIIPMFTTDKLNNVNQRAIDLFLSKGFNVDPAETYIQDIIGKRKRDGSMFTQVENQERLYIFLSGRFRDYSVHRDVTAGNKITFWKYIYEIRITHEDYYIF